MERCKQCGTELAEGEGEMAKITQRRSGGHYGPRQRVVTEELGPFCKEKRCAAYYQMGCEG